MFKVKQITPTEILSNINNLGSYFYEQLNPLVDANTWMTDWNHIAQRFKLFQFGQMSRDEIMSYQWDTSKVEEIIKETLKNVNNYIPIEQTVVTLVPALPFKWFEHYDQSIWVNGFTNGKKNIIIAVPPEPDEQYLKYMVSHEAHHACPLNPLYNLTLDTFSLAEWFKMEGTAEYFSLSLYEDKRWWKESFTEEIEANYWNEVKDQFNTVDD